MWVCMVNWSDLLFPSIVEQLDDCCHWRTAHRTLFKSMCACTAKQMATAERMRFPFVHTDHALIGVVGITITITITTTLSSLLLPTPSDELVEVLQANVPTVILHPDILLSTFLVRRQ